MPPKGKSKRVSKRITESDTQAATQVESMLGNVMSELKALKQQVAAISKEKESAVEIDRQIPSTSGMSNVPAITMRVPSSSLPMMDIVPENVRKDILKGKNINLAQLLLPARERGIFTGSRDITIGDETLSLKPRTDDRLTKQLTIQEFIKAFNIYKNVICEVFPDRRLEMDKYTSNIIEISAKYPGFSFYEYHLEFAGRAAFFLEHHNIAVDWGCTDDRLLTQVVAGRKANTCALCNAFDHTSRFCPLNADKAVNNVGSNKTCMKFNSQAGCTFDPCRYAHKCALCNGNHTSHKCHVKNKN